MVPTSIRESVTGGPPPSNKRSNLQEQLRFALHLLTLIPQSKPKTTIPKLMSQMEAWGITKDKRTYERTMKTLCDVLKIDCDQESRPYQFSWGGHRPVFLERFRTVESLVWALVGQYLQYQLPPTLAKPMQEFIEEADHWRKWGDESESKPRSWIDKIAITPASYPLEKPSIDADILFEITSALYNDKRLLGQYRNRLGVESELDINPLGLVHHREILYLLATYTADEDAKVYVFALHRFLTAKATVFSSVTPKDFDLNRFIEEGRHSWGKGHQVHVVFEIAPHLRLKFEEQPLADDQKIEVIEDRVRVSVTVVDTWDLQHFLHGFGDEIRILEYKVLEESGSEDETVR